MAERARLPKGLRRLLSALTYEDKLRKFRYAKERDPASEEELQRFILVLTRELYNAGFDHWLEDDEELS
jgi:hypothetical protein